LVYHFFKLSYLKSKLNLPGKTIHPMMPGIPVLETAGTSPAVPICANFPELSGV
jgi:hypothetical protein